MGGGSGTIMLSEHCAQLISCTNAIPTDYTFRVANPRRQRCWRSPIFSCSRFLSLPPPAPSPLHRHPAHLLAPHRDPRPLTHPLALFLPRTY
jgi:hypothetical protein